MKRSTKHTAETVAFVVFAFLFLAICTVHLLNVIPGVACLWLAAQSSDLADACKREEILQENDLYERAE